MTVILTFNGSVCPGQTAVFECTTTTGVLIWFSRSQHLLYTINSTPDSHFDEFGIFSALLLNVSGDRITSRINTTAAQENNGTEVTCKDGIQLNKDTKRIILLCKFGIQSY